MIINKGKSFIIEDDLKRNSIWKVDEKDDLYYPVKSEDDFPNDIYDLDIRSDFLTCSGIRLFGSIVGVKNIYSITIFANNKIFRFNKNLPDRMLEELEKLSHAIGKKITLEEFSPLKYTTTIDIEGLKNVSGFIDFSKKSTLEEQLWQANED